MTGVSGKRNTCLDVHCELVQDVLDQLYSPAIRAGAGGETRWNIPFTPQLYIYLWEKQDGIFHSLPNCTFIYGRNTMEYFSPSPRGYLSCGENVLNISITPSSEKFDISKL
jgi:hypothetical protein